MGNGIVSDSLARFTTQRRNSRILVLAVALVAAASPNWAQSLYLPQTNPLGMPGVGIRLYSASAYFGYSSWSVPTASAIATGGVPFRSSSADTGGTVMVGWSRKGDKKTRFGFTYTSSYNARLSSSGLNSLNHHFAFDLGRNRRLSPRWSFDLSGNAGISDLQGFLFLPSRSAQLANVPTTFDDLAAAVLAGRFNNNEFASILTGAPVVESPARALLYGNRMLTASMHAGLSYTASSRLSIQMGITGNNNLHVPDIGNPVDLQYRYLVPRTSGATVGLGVAYSLSPRTLASFDFSVGRYYSGFYDGYTSSATVSLGRVLIGRRWFAQTQGGAGVVNPIGGAGYSRRPRGLGGASLGYKALAHTFLGSYTWSAGDNYGLGAASTETASGAWQWARPGRSWVVYSNLGRQRLLGSPLRAIDGWRVSAGFSRSLGDETSAYLQYTYFVSSGGFGSGPLSFAQPGFRVASVRLGVAWTPGLRALRQRQRSMSATQYP